jgi:tight adherence protein B
MTTIAVLFELESRRQFLNHNLIIKTWPEVLDSLISAASAGLSAYEAFSDLSQIGPMALRKHFKLAVDQLDAGSSIDQVAQGLKDEFKDPHSDRTLELIRLTNHLGGSFYLETLKHFASVCRQAISLDGELGAKQGWVKGTAKLGVISPLIIVLLLSARPENASVYNSPAGLLILVIGLLVCLVAYRLIHILGRMPNSPRIFT